MGAPDALGAGALRFRLWRSVSWTPGAEGAPRVGAVVVEEEAVGTMRRDCSDLLLGGWLGASGGDGWAYHDGWFGGGL